PTTTRRPTARSERTDSSVVSSNESGYRFWTCGSLSSGLNSGTIFHCSLPCARLSLECCTQTTGTSAARAFSTTVPTFATTVSRSYASPTTPFWTSITSSGGFGRFSSVVMASPWFAAYSDTWTLSVARVGSVDVPVPGDRRVPAVVPGRDHEAADHALAALEVAVEDVDAHALRCL